MLEALELLEKEVEQIEALVVTLKAKALPDFYLRAQYRKEEAKRFQVICDLLEAEYLDRL